MKIGRWITADPIGFGDGPNVYAYVHNNPFSYVDPDGQFAFSISIISGVFGLTGITLTVAEATVIMSAATVGVAGYIAYVGNLAYDRICLNERIEAAEELDRQEEEKKKREKNPPYNGADLGSDPTKCPGEGFEWKGNGPPESGMGNWAKGKGNTKESLHPDLNHEEPIGPHWDYTGPDFPSGVRIFPNGTWENKGK